MKVLKVLGLLKKPPPDPQTIEKINGVDFVKNKIYNDRIGVLNLSSDFTSVPKLLLLDRIDSSTQNRIASNHI